LTGGSLEISGVGLNETRTGYFEALGRMGTTLEIQGNGPTSMGEPTGSILTPAPTGVMKPVSIPATEFPLVHDDLLMIAVMSAFASEGEVSRFDGAEELRHKESDRLKGLADGIRGLGGSAEIEGDSLLVRGGGLAGGTADAKKDHRLAMAFTVGALAARSESRIDGIEWADVTFPGFLPTLRFLGAQIDEG
jgi:3-phosphoshikimate 1-carboxyvinyltransferase